MVARGDMVRVVLYGCSHRPKISALSAPKPLSDYMCYTCGRTRVVKGSVTTWAGAVIDCRQCKYTFANTGKYGSKKMISIAVMHANSRLHRVEIRHDGEVLVIKPQSFQQLPLIDDLMLPE